MMAGKPHRRWVTAFRRLALHTALVGARRRAHAAVGHAPARADALTGLPDRKALQEWLGHSLAHAQGRPMAVLLLDLDDFRAINDSAGHDLGDALLLQFSERLLGALPEQARLGRFGGDEFCVVLPGADAAAAHAFGAQVVQSFQTPFQLGVQRRYSSCSVGYAMYPADADAAAELISRADMALHRAKSEGRGGVRRFEPALQKRADDHFELQSMLRDALRSGYQFSLHFQPQHALKDGRVLGLEALLRWTHPQHGAIPPARFIPAAEAGGLIGALGEWALEEACRCSAALRAAGWPLRIALNLSAHELRNGMIVARVMGSLAKYGLPADALEIELTESTLIDDVGTAAEAIAQLEALGIHTTIDDFGTGFSSLSYLSALPVRSIKIDRSFVTQLEHSEKGRRLVKGLVQLAHSLELSVLAEGVENERQLALLCSYGCDAFQGWLASKALPLSQLQAYLANWYPARLHASDPPSPDCGKHCRRHADCNASPGERAGRAIRSETQWSCHLVGGQ